MELGKSFYAKLYSYSTLRKREPLNAQDSDEGVLNFCVRGTPPREKKKIKKIGK